jgi:hypothetical protein
VCGGFSLSGSADQPLAFDTWRGASRFFSKALCLFRQALI